MSGLGLGTTEGRIDLRGLSAPAPTVVGEFAASVALVKEMSDFIIVRGSHWKGLDLSEGKLDKLRFHDSHIEGCRFDKASCQDWRLWGTSIVNTSFKRANLRKAVLGGVEDGRRNHFRGVDFSNADLRQTANKSGDFVACRFSSTKLTKVDFQGSTFADCVFEGELREVAFHRTAFKSEDLPPNEMKHVDFSRATLRYVEFRNLDLGSVCWPNDDEHVVIDDFRTTLDRGLEELKKRADLPSRKLAAYLSVCRKWAGQNQRTGVVNKRDIAEACGDEGLQEFLRVFRPN